MTDDFDPYRVLGLLVGADEAAIRKRYRDLVRRHHPDVSADSEKAHQRFVRIQQAYRLLLDPDERARWERKLGFSGAPARPAGRRSEAGFADLLKQARYLLRQRRLREARDAAAAAIELNPYSAEAYRLLGDIYMAGGSTQMCLELYREAELLSAPAAPPAAEPVAPEEPAPARTAPRPALRRSALMVGLLAGLGALGGMLATGFGGNPGAFIGLGCGSAFLLMATGVAAGLVEPLDELLGLVEVREVARGSAPGAVYLLALSLLSPLVGLVAYGALALLTQSHSAGLLKAYGLTFAIMVVAWLGGGEAPVLWAGPSVAFAAVLAGWIAGSCVAPGDWWRR